MSYRVVILVVGLLLMSPRSPSVVILDLAMPRLGGLEAIRYIQRFDPRIQIVVLSGFLADDAKAKLAALGVQALAKPVDLSALEQLVSRGRQSA